MVSQSKIYESLKSMIRKSTIGIYLLLSILTGCTSPEREPLKILYTGGLGGYLEPCGCREGRVGGLARLAQAFNDSARRGGEGILRVDAGDFAETYLLEGDPKNQFLLRALAYMDYDAVNVTALDLMAGETQLRWARDSLKLPLISCNLTYHDSEQRVFPGWIIKKKGDRRVGIIGAGSVRPLEMRRSRADQNLKYLDPEGVIRQAVTELKSQCDLIILLCDFNARLSRELAAKFKEINLIISVMELTPNQRVRQFGYAYVAGPSRKGKAVTALRLETIAPDSSTWFSSQTLLDSSFQEDVRVAKLIEQYRATQPTQVVSQPARGN